MNVSLDMFVKQLADSGIVAPGRLAHFVPPNAAPADVEQLAERLVAEKCLTPFQADAIRHGRAHLLVVDDYTILDKIGAGGMGQVFLARHRSLKRLVALKVLSPLQTLAQQRFEREAEAAGKLSHPNIIATFDAGSFEGSHYLAMEYVEGGDLSKLVRRHGPLSVAAGVGCVIQAARGLEYAHCQGVIHRDVKPSNLLLDKAGKVKILDLGLARVQLPPDGSATDGSLTGSGDILGTVDYMAPEQALDVKAAGAQSDIYSLGCTLYFLLTGRPPYSADTAMLKLMAHREKPIPSLRRARSDVPVELDAVFRRMVAKRPADRFATMRETCEALEAACPTASSSLGDTIQSTHREFLETQQSDRRTLPWPRRRLRVVVGIVSLCLIGSAAVAVYRADVDWANVIGGRSSSPDTADALAASRPVATNSTGSSLTDAVELAAARWALSRGGKVTVTSPRLDGERLIERQADLPPELFQVVRIDLFSNKQRNFRDDELHFLTDLPHLYDLRLEATGITDAAMPHVARATNLTHLNVSTNEIGDDGLAHLAPLKKLMTLQLGNLPRVTNAGLEHLAHLTDLESLSLASTSVDDAGLARLASFAKLRVLSINRTRITDDGLRVLEHFPALTDLDLSYDVVTDEGLACLSERKSLRSLNLRNVNVGAAAIAKLKIALPDCKIQH